MNAYCLLCLLPLMTPPVPAPMAPGAIDTHAAVMHLVRQERPAPTPAERDAIVDMVSDELRGPDLTAAVPEGW